MLKYFKITKLMLIPAVIMGLLGSCNKDDNGASVTLKAFGPSGVKHGETIKIIGTGLNQVTSVIMPVGVEVPASAFTSKSATLIELTVPEESTTGRITLKTPHGDVVSKALFGSAYEISVTSYTPQTAVPGENITITGQYLNYVKSVTFNKGQVVTEFVSQSVSQLVVQVPLAAQTGPFSLMSNMSPTPQVVETDAALENLLLTVTLPAATGISPASIEQTKTLTITGTNLDNVGEVDFVGVTADGGKVTDFVSQTATEIKVNVPNTAVSGAITLVAFSGVKVVTSQVVTVIEPAITTLPVGRNGADIVIQGSALNLVASILFPDGTSGVSVDAAAFKNVAGDGSSITVTVPDAAIPGSIVLTTIYEFQVTVSGFDITVPKATSYSTSTPGATLTITGTDLDLVSSILFPDGTSVNSFVSQTPTSLKVVIPNTATAGYLKFTIENGFSILQKPQFGSVGGPDPVADAALVFFDFNGSGKDSWWGSGSVVTGSPNADGTKFWTINSALNGWSDMFWRNGGNNFPGGTIGTSVDNYVVKLDIYVAADLSAGNIKLRLQDTDNGEGDFWYCMGPAAPTGHMSTLNATGGWTTITIPISKFKDNYGWGSNVITDMSKIDQFGMAFDNGSATLNVSIDNVRFEKIN